MPTPAKPFEVLVSEKKSHRTKRELEQRKQGEEALASGQCFKESAEVKSNPIAHKEFIRVDKILKNINKNDALYESVINRYCIMQAECRDFEIKRESFYRDLEELTNEKERLVDSGEITLSEYFKLKNTMQASILKLDSQVQSKRKMLFDIEKENIMTIASALRCVPKKAEQKSNPIMEALAND